MTPEQRTPVLDKLDQIIDLLTRRVPVKRGEWQPTTWLMQGPYFGRPLTFRVDIDAAGFELSMEVDHGLFPPIRLGRWLFED